MNYPLQDLIDVPKVQELLDSLSNAFSLSTAIIDTRDQVLTASGCQDLCKHFHEPGTIPKQACLRGETYLGSHVHDGDITSTYRCPHGLIHAATPLIIGGEHRGNVFVGKVFLETPDLDLFRNQARQHHFDEQAYLAAVVRVPVLTQEQLDLNLRVVRKFTELLGAIGLQRLDSIQREAQLRESEEQYRLLAENVHDVIGTMDPSGRFTYVSPSIERMLGYTQEESLRNTLEQVLTPASAAVARQRLNDIIATAASGQRVEPGCAELELVCKDGSTRWGEVSYQARQDASGTLINIVCTNRDINARHRADDALRQLEQEKSVILQTACDGFVLMSQDGRLLEVNDAYCRMTGYTREELLTLCIPDLEVVEQPETIEHHREQVLRHGSDRFETHHRCKDGRLIDVEVTVDHLRSH